MIYFSSVLLWISPYFVENRRAQNIRLRSRYTNGHLLIVFEELNLAEAPLCFFARPVWAAQILAAFFRNHLVTALYFFDH
jgi:hypothetical protein